MAKIEHRFATDEDFERLPAFVIGFPIRGKKPLAQQEESEDADDAESEQ
jgi:hypothetical protein